MDSLSSAAIEALHPSLWRASQLARADTRCRNTGHPSLSGQLPGGGWPEGTLTELLVQQPGIGELRLLAPALASVSGRKVVLVAPPHAPQALALAALGLAPQNLIWIRSERTADTLWATEQVLCSGSTGAVLLWQQHVRPESLRRLHLAAQQGETLFFIFRPLAAAQDASPV
jgi:protein ImuA